MLVPSISEGVPAASIFPAKYPDIRRSDFPTDFKFGASTSALQGQNPHRATWVMLLFPISTTKYDTCSANPGNITDGKGEINQKGIDFYHNLIDELVKNGTSKIISSIIMKRWTTINEPSVFAQYGYKLGLPIPDDPTKNPYIAAHNIILAHSAAARLYRENYKGYQGGEIGISVSIEWFEPYSASIADKEATTRAFSFLVGWFLEPLVYGDYPFMMKALVRDRLPTFKDEEKEVVKGGIDFIGINYYTSRYARSLPLNTNVSPVGGYIEDQYVKQEVDTDGRPIGDPVNGNPNIYSVPDGLRDALIYMKNHYNNPTFYITENGISEPRDDTIPLEQALVDYHRIMFILRHLNAVKEAIREGVNVKSHFVWALIDCMEVGSGYSARFGLNYTDYSDNKLRRYPKRSAQGLSQFLKD
ncbi:hypothetical protein IFM89_038287 [Coptis chinensis]|uniref:Beta-glucosidase n=1 Tax=Coptis chinensis TaxID=261450 RepID=A0A835H223_9MAGN|nr:hypothetical protein IFM89_038287 [Coptis chinensis]